MGNGLGQSLTGASLKVGMFLKLRRLKHAMRLTDVLCPRYLTSLAALRRSIEPRCG